MTFISGSFKPIVLDLLDLDANPMKFTHACLIPNAFLAGLLCATATSALASEARTAGVPDFSANGVSWEAESMEFIPPPSGPGPVGSDKAHPYISNQVARARGVQPTFRVADLSNPILKPWVVEALRKVNEAVLAGKPMFNREVRCWAPGVPAFLLDPGQLYFIQTAKEVWMIGHDDHRVRRVYLNSKHSVHPTPSWYGESVGRYEGDTLVVDTIGLNDKTLVDNYRTPHTDQMHVVERFRLIDSGNTLEATVTVDDPGAFNTVWSAIQRFRSVHEGPLPEKACAEDTNNYFGYDLEPIPQADKPDF
ncbi:MAG TPA: hypothetical protein VNH44_03305 [Micropepsaceae bacterium]|nr:hypothetical protein [Micropepsaceae bacterium]